MLNFIGNRTAFFLTVRKKFWHHRRTGNRGQTCLPVGLKVIDNSPLPARYQITLHSNGRVRGSLKPSPLSIADFRLLRTHVVLVQASISSLHHITKAEQSYKEPANFYPCNRRTCYHSKKICIFLYFFMSFLLILRVFNLIIYYIKSKYSFCFRMECKKNCRKKEMELH